MMTLHYRITKSLNRMRNDIYMCIGCNRYGVGGLNETVPYEMPDWVLERPFRNRIRSGICPQCWKEYVQSKLLYGQEKK